MFESLVGYHGRKINIKARFVNGLPGIVAGPQPKKNQIVTLCQVIKEDGITYYRIKGYGNDWFYATRFKEIK